ncbi:hypothetical protein QBC42DRAFT_285891 [Cladorrhinum samala]|uniref:Uncharacterized protein n=1 Tax=Cladorrhinum samala TaxID=585594 RepID=A0AAV9HSJ7_9PEZI|nr:hypothetical protein QBC42DRAFT_285891 [Cladorrhinum samala]
MKLLLLFNALALTGQALASVQCTVRGSSLVKRMCEFDNCPSTGFARAGQVLHAGCLADCSTEADPWVKLLDDTYVRATEATISNCQSSSTPSSIKDLPRCHVQSKSPKPSNCATLAASRLSNLSKEKLNPPPFKRSAPSNSTIIAARDVPAGNSSTSANSTTTVITPRKPALARKSVNVLPKWYKHRAVRSNAVPVPANVTVPAPGSNGTAGVNGTEVSGAKKLPVLLSTRAIEAPNATFPNATETSNATVTYKRKPRAPRRAQLWG